MQDYADELLLAINKYREDDMASRERLRDLLCVISEQEKMKEDPFVKELLYLASQKMRMFGYNVQNGFEQNPGNAVSGLMHVQDEAVKNIYRSKSTPGNILDKSQQEVIEFFQGLNPRRMLVSAPTSYGKTFLMRELLFLNTERYRTVVLVFPTVALLQENAVEISDFVREKELDYRVIKSVDSEVDPEERNIFVFTPERTIQLLAAYPDIRIDFFFYDEIYKIDEDFCNEELDEMLEKTKRSKEGSPDKNVFLGMERGKTFRIALYLLLSLIHI